jgi:hypothetical protein
MPELYAKANAMLGVLAKLSENSAEVRFRDSKGQAYVIDFPEPILGGMIAALLAIAPQLKPSGAGQVLNMTSGRVFSLPDGRIGLELTLEGTLRLPLIFQKKGIAALRKSLDQLEAQSKKEPDKLNRH